MGNPSDIFIYQSIHRFLCTFRKIDMAGVKQQIDILTRSIHEPVNFRRCLYSCSHMMMETALHPFFFGDGPQLIHPCQQFIPFFISKDRLLATKNRHCLSLDAAALLGTANHSGSHLAEKIQLLFKGFDSFFFRPGGKKSGKPAVTDLHSPQIQGLFQHHRILWIFISDF